MPIIRPFSTSYPRLFPAGYSGSQVLRFALLDGPEQRLYQTGDYGLSGYKNLQSSINAFSVGSGSLYGSISGHNPSNIAAAISAVRCQTLSPKKYIIGYEDGVPQFLETRQQFRCVDFLPAYIKSWVATVEDLPVVIKGSVSAYKDLSADIIAGKTWFGADRCLAAAIKGYISVSDNLLTSIVGSYCQTLSPKRYIIGYENGVPQFLETKQQFRCVDFLPAYVKIIYRTTGSLSATIRGWVSSYSDLGIYMIKGVRSESEDLPTIVKSYGFLLGSLPASVIGSYCQTLSPKRYIIGYENGVPQFLETRQQFRCVDFLPAYIKSWITDVENLPALIRGWVSSYKDLSADITAGKTWFGADRCLAAAIKSITSVSDDLSTSVIGSYCQTLSPKRYIIGYENGVPQFLETRQQFRCVDFLPAYIKRNFAEDLSACIFLRERANVDLPVYLNAVWKQGDYGLRAILHGWNRQAPYDLPAFIWGVEERDLQAIIGMHPPVDLPARLRVVLQSSKDLLANIYGWDSKNLLAILRGVVHKDLPAYLFSVQPEDLPAYLKVWPQEDLPADLHGWGTKDLSAYIDWNEKQDLPAIIGGHPWVNLGMILRAWAREVPANLLAHIKGFTYEDIGAIIRATYINDLPGYLYPIVPENLQALIHGWDTKDLLATIYGVYGANDLRAYLNVSGGFVELPGCVKSMKAVGVFDNLRGKVYIGSILMQQDNLSAYMAAHVPIDLSAVLTVKGGSSDLVASVYPKSIYMSGIISVATMEHLDLPAIVNYICRSSSFLNLSASIRAVYLSNLAATITGYKIPQYSADLGATIGYADTFVMDMLPISLSIASGYQIEDKIPIYVNVATRQALLAAYINCTPQYKDMAATVTPVWLHKYEFDNTKSREIVYDLNHARQINWYEVVEMYFKSIVSDYFYVGGERDIYKIDRLLKWVLEISSYVPEDVALNIRRKLHRVKNIYDLTSFDTLDEAIRFAIDYVTSYNYGNLSGYLNAIPSTYHTSDLPVRIRWFTPTDSNLPASVTPQAKTYVLGFDEKVEFI